MNKRLSVLAICLVALICTQVIPLSLTMAQTPGDTVPVIAVHWNRHQWTEDNTYDGSGEEWLFGESIELVIFYENGTNIADNDYEVNRDELVNFTLIIPTRFFEGDRELEQASVGANMGTMNMSADMHISYNVPRDEWYVFSAIHEMGKTEPPGPTEFFDFNSQLSGITTVGEYFVVNFVGTFNTDSPRGVYQTYADAMDNASNFIHPAFFSTQPGEYPLPPIALDCSLDDRMGTWHKPPEYDLRVLNETYHPVQFIDAGEYVYFELTMDKEIGFAAFDLGPVASWDQRQYLKNVTQWWPDDWCNPDTTWTTNQWEEPPRLGFFYNASAAPPNDIGAFIFYTNTSFVWRDDEYGYYGWESYADPIIDTTGMLSDFFNFHIAGSQAVDPYTVKWKGSFTNLVCNRTEYPMYGPPKVKYGTTFHVWPHDLRFWGTQDIEGFFAEPSFEFMQSNGLVLAFNDILIQAWLQEYGTSTPLESIHQDDWFTVSMDIHAPIELFNYTSGPYEVDPIMHVWRNDTLLLDNISLRIDGYTNGWNDTHNWNAYTNIEFTIDVETLMLIDQYCFIQNSTYRTYDWVLVDDVWIDSNSGLTDLIAVTNVQLNLGTDYSFLQFDAQLLSNTPDGDYHFWDFLIDQYFIDQHNQTGIWETYIYPQSDFFMGGQVHWAPNFFILGNAWKWIPEPWTVTDEGALDLDGNLDTTYDQYFVKRVHYWHDEWNRTEDSMHVDIMFDPTARREWHPDGDEFQSHNWMGLMTEELTYTWNETFYWFHTDMTPVNASELVTIRDVVWHDVAEQIPAPGYDMISWMTLNRTWQDLLDEWWWLGDNTWEWSWFGFSTDQNFNLATEENSMIWAHFRSEFAGLLIFIDNVTINGGNGVPDFNVHDGFVDTSEVSHYFLVDHVGDIEFTYPFGSTEDTGEEIIMVHSGYDESIDFGVRITEVNGTLFPVHTAVGTGIKGCWDYYQSAEGLIGIDNSDFDHILSTSTIDEIAFDVHYHLHLPNTPENLDPNNNLIQIKVDQYIGDWTLHHFDNSVLEGRGLAITYFGSLGTQTYAEFSVDDTPVASNNDDSQIGDMYRFGAEGRTFAAVQMGSQVYDWGKDGQTYTCDAATVPMGAFSAMFYSQSGKSVTHWEMDTSYFFMLSGFTHWDGYSINNDPSFGIYTSALNMIVGPPPGADPFDMLMGILFVGITLLVIVIIVVAMNIRRRGKGTTKGSSKPVDDYWAKQ